MTVLTEGTHAGEFIVSEANGTRSRDAVIVLSGQDLRAGHVVGKVTTGTAASAAVAGNTGNGAMGAVTVSGAAKLGVYVLTIVAAAANAGEFVVEDPDGVTVGNGTVAVAFSGGGLAFTLADGATDFAAGDQFRITVSGSSKLKEWNPANTDGSQYAAAIMFDAVDATGGDAHGVAIVRAAEVNAAELQYFTGATTNQKAAALQQLAAPAGIIGR
jgi:hypothetical protein